MEIKNPALQNLDPYRTRQAAEGSKSGRPGNTEGGSPSKSSTGGDRVTLSSSALLHTVAHAEVGAASEVRQEKVDAIKELLAAGEYAIDLKKVAEKLVQSEAALADTFRE